MLGIKIITKRQIQQLLLPRLLCRAAVVEIFQVSSINIDSCQFVFFFSIFIFNFFGLKASLPVCRREEAC